MLLNWGVGKDAWESLGLQEIKPVNLKGNQSWIFIGRTKAEAPIVWSPDVKSWLIGKDPDAGKDWSQEEKGTTEDEMASPIWRTGVWATSGSWWWTGNPGVLQSTGLQSAADEWATELNRTTRLPRNSQNLMFPFKDNSCLCLFFWNCLSYVFYLSMYGTFFLIYYEIPNGTVIFSQ